MNRFNYNDLPVLTNEDVILRPIRPEDTDLIVKWRNNPSVMKNFVFRQEMTPEIHNKWFQTKVLTGDVIQYIIIKKEDETPIGSIYYRDIDFTNNHAEYGIFIGEEMTRGKGLGKKASRLLIDFGINELKLHKIFLRVFSDNYAAINMYHALGFQLEGIAKDLVYIDNQYKTMLFMAINAEE